MQYSDDLEFTFEGEMQNALYRIVETLSDWLEKIVSGALLSSVLTYFDADISLYIILLYLMAADFVCGVFLGYSTGEGWNLAKCWQGVRKFLIFNIYIFLAGFTTLILQKINSCPSITPVDIMIGYLSFHEISSILRNLDLMGFKTPPLLKLLITKSNRKIEKTVENIVDDDEFSSRVKDDKQ